MWLAGHMPVSAATSVAVGEATGSTVLGLAAGMASHYLLDLGPWWTTWKPSRRQFYIAGAIDAAIGSLIVAFAFFYWKGIPLVLLGGLVGILPDLHKVSFLKSAYAHLPGRLLVAIHRQTHRWQTTNLVLASIWWAICLFGGSLFLYLVCHS